MVEGKSLSMDKSTRCWHSASVRKLRMIQMLGVVDMGSTSQGKADFSSGRAGSGTGDGWLLLGLGISLL